MRIRERVKALEDERKQLRELFNQLTRVAEVTDAVQAKTIERLNRLETVVNVMMGKPGGKAN